MVKKLASFLLCIFIFISLTCPASAAEQTQSVALAAGEAHTLVLSPFGRVFGAGDNRYGECDVWGWSDIVAIAAGRFFSAGAQKNGSVFLTGKTDDMDVSLWRNIVSLAAGEYFLAGLDTDGKVHITGTFSDVETVEGWTDIVLISAGYQHLVAVDKNGNFYGAGLNGDGQCNLSVFQSHRAPISSISCGKRCTLAVFADGSADIAGVTIKPGDTSDEWKLPKNVAAAAAGSVYILLILKDGTVYTNADVSEPSYQLASKSSISDVVIGYDVPNQSGHIVTLGTDRALHAYDGSGQTSPIVSPRCDVADFHPFLAPVEPAENLDQILFASQRELIAVKPDGTIVSTDTARDYTDWTDLSYIASNAGATYYAALRKDGTVLTNNADAGTVCNWRGIVKLAVSSTHILGLRWDGRVFSTLSADNDPSLGGVSTWRTPCTDIAAARNTSFGLTRGGTLAYTNTPQQVTLYSTFRLLVQGDWSDISAIFGGPSHFIGLRPNGTLVGAGRNDELQCNVDSLQNVKKVALSDYHTLALTEDETVTVLGTSEQSKLAVNEIAAWRDVVSLCASSYYAAALRRDGKIMVATTYTKNIPYEIKQIAEGWDFYRHSTIVMRDVNYQNNILSVKAVLYRDTPGALRITGAGYTENGKEASPFFLSVPSDAEAFDFSVSVFSSFKPASLKFFLWRDGLCPAGEAIQYIYNGGNFSWMKK